MHFVFGQFLQWTRTRETLRVCRRLLRRLHDHGKLQIWQVRGDTSSWPNQRRPQVVCPLVVTDSTGGACCLHVYVRKTELQRYFTAAADAAAEVLQETGGQDLEGVTDLKKLAEAGIKPLDSPR